MRDKPLRFGMIVGEDSGDILGASLIQALKKHFPDATFEGIGGERMIAEGFHSFYPMQRLSVMGLIEPLKRLPELLKLRKWLIQHFLKLQPHVFIGIDAPDFNLGIEKILKQHAIKTVHYVSPTVWAWRKGRIHGIKKSVDLMLSLFPFEMPIYEAHQIPICFVGHPLADKIPLVSDKNAARAALGLAQDKKIIALLPGSREQELKYLAEDFIQTALWLKQQDPQIQFITACPNTWCLEKWQAYCSEFNATFIQSYMSESHHVMAAADAILSASGTATLEAMLIKRPTVIAYKLSPLIYRLGKWLIKIPFIGLPNILAGKCIMPEFLQSQVDPQAMGKVLLDYIKSPEKTQAVLPEFEKLHQVLKRNAAQTAAQRIVQLLNE